jgi:hypothetical protein
MQKPKIKKEKGFWICYKVDQAYIGIGISPHIAYHNWKAQVRL